VKFKIIIFFLASVFLLTWAEKSYANEEVPHFKVKSANLDLPVVFEDQNISNEIMKVIIEDANLIYNHMTKYKYYPHNKKKEYIVNGKKYECDRYLAMKGPHRHSPDAYQDEFGHLISLDKKDYLVITVKLSNAYKEAFALTQKNSKELSELYKFIDFMNNLANEKINDIPSYFYLYGSAKIDKDQLFNFDKQKFIDSYSQMRFRKPSILELFEGHNDLPEIGIRFLAMTYVFSENGKYMNAFVFVYDEKKWKMLIVYPGT